MLCRAWKEELDKAMATEGKVWVKEKRFNSFAPPRQNCTAKWCVLLIIIIIHAFTCKCTCMYMYMYINTHTYMHVYKINVV